MHLGFTGTRTELQPRQLSALRDVLGYYQARGYVWLHHGDCVGADEAAHGVAGELGMLTHGHPADAGVYRAFCKFDVCELPRPYLERNRDVVDASAIVVGCPRHPIEVNRSGTWSTLRYAKRQNKSLVVVMPDGRVYREG